MRAGVAFVVCFDGAAAQGAAGEVASGVIEGVESGADASREVSW